MISKFLPCTIASFGSASTWRSTFDMPRTNWGSRSSLAVGPVDDLLAAARRHGFPISYDDLVESKG
jgi:hypothetical protein